MLDMNRLPNFLRSFSAVSTVDGVKSNLLCLNIAKFSTDSFNKRETVEVETTFGAIDRLPELSTKHLSDLVKPKLHDNRRLTHYVHSTTHLQLLVGLFGVYLESIEKKNNDDWKRILLRADLKLDVFPRFHVLQKFASISVLDFGQIITKCPNVLESPIENISRLLSHFEQTGFASDQIKSMIVKRPSIMLLLPTSIENSQIALQIMTELTPGQINSLIWRNPNLLEADFDKISDVRNVFRDQFLFSLSDFQKLILRCPSVLSTRRDTLVEKFVYLNREMQISNDLIADSGEVFSNSIFNIRALHLYLKSLNRAQFDPEKPLYVSLRNFIKPPLENSEELGINRQHFIKFMKTL